MFGLTVGLVSTVDSSQFTRAEVPAVACRPLPSAQSPVAAQQSPTDVYTALTVTVTVTVSVVRSTIVTVIVAMRAYF